MLELREAHIQTKIDNEIKLARANATSNRRVALAALKRKHLYELQLEKMGGTRMTLEAQAMSIEAANVNLETMKAMERGAEAMKHIHQNMSIDKVDQTMEDIREQMDLATEVSDAISQPQLFGAQIDDDQLLEELEELEQQELDRQLLGLGRVPVSTPGLPSQPLGAPVLSPPQSAIAGSSVLSKPQAAVAGSSGLSTPQAAVARSSVLSTPQAAAARSSGLNPPLAAASSPLPPPQKQRYVPPPPPPSKQPVVEEDEDDELAELRESMGMAA
ncbi:ESCRT-III subunit protein snf7 [Coemansia aciculifera]|uniref:ESCRT-III subunit protein snf7 n=1 Tax=Coemansia aciculifera TaxID=417176 RepID=A0ACC1M3Q7_9FUNG|nr:ESCRT-III subunit protein snf7 [Coemansia aciculifera]